MYLMANKAGYSMIKHQYATKACVSLAVTGIVVFVP